MRNLLFGVLAVAAGYVLIGTLLDSVILPEDEPGPPFYPPPGSQFVSKTEGFRQTVLKRENRLVWVELELEPHAAGPPEHVHTSFAENFAVAEGTLSILFQGQRRVVRAGETLLVPARALRTSHSTRPAPVWSSAGHWNPSTRCPSSSRCFSRRRMASSTSHHRTIGRRKRCCKCRASVRE